MGQPNVAAAAVSLLALAALSLSGCGGPTEADIQKILDNQTSGIVRLPKGEILLNHELHVRAGATDLDIAGTNTVLKAAPGFDGRALLVIENGTNITVRDLEFDGNREEVAKPFDAAPPENAFRVWYKQNGILADEVDGFELTRVKLANVVHFPILVSRSKRVRIHEVTVAQSGNVDARGKTNLSGGILIEEGTTDFEVRNADIRGITGNGLWTHSLFTSPRLSDGLLTSNYMEDIGLDAIQIGHATKVLVERNRGYRIGYPVEGVDTENGRIPVALDTAGNVDLSEYVSNSFEEINGKCIDLDGFHDGTVRNNSCVNTLGAGDYPHGHYGIVMNNSHPDAHSNNIELRANTVDGAKYGGLFVMGSENRIIGNRFLNVNLAGCNENQKMNCLYLPSEPELLESGIYLSRGVARQEDTRGNVIEENRVTGYKMDTRCLASGPGVDRAENTIGENDCIDAPARP